ncbi:MAG: hypothetical protein JWM18_1165, partial [Chloroflexi bacterium]|nr:hypothetical protein [Chloroflexota bacterium]
TEEEDGAEPGAGEAHPGRAEETGTEAAETPEHGGTA